MTQQIHQLAEGDYFRFMHAPNRFRNLRVTHISPSSATIIGEIRDGSSWKGLGASYTIAPTSQVEKMEKPVFEVSQEIIEKISQEKRVPEPSITNIIKFPINQEFKIRDIADQYNMSPANVYNTLKRKYPDLEPIQKEKTTNGRGKPTNIYLITNQDDQVSEEFEEISFD